MLAEGEGRYQCRQKVHLNRGVSGSDIRPLSDDVKPEGCDYLESQFRNDDDQGRITAMVGHFSKAGLGIFWLAPKCEAC